MRLWRYAVEHRTCLLFLLMAVAVGEGAVNVAEESEASQPLSLYVRAGTLAYAALAQYPKDNVQFESEDAKRMTPHVASLLEALAAGALERLPSAQLVVRRAYLPPPDNLLEASGLHHEGRALDVGLLARGQAAVPNDGLATLGSLASDVGFNYVSPLEDGQTVHMSATDDSCRRAIDLAFLVDASGSISQGDYEKALDFVADVAEQFDLGANETRVGMSIFSGYTGHQSTIAGVPDCPKGTLFEANGLGCICPTGTQCIGPGSGTGCSSGRLSSTNELVYFYNPRTCGSCKCDIPDDWKPMPAAETVFELGAYTTYARLRAAAEAADFPAGGTHTSEGLRHIREQVFTSDGGARPQQIGTPRVLVVLTDGRANPGFEPAAEAAKLHAAGVTVFAVGVGNFDSSELRDMASAPKDRRVFELERFNELAALAAGLAPLTCFAPTPLEPSGPVDLTLPRDRTAYYRVACTPLPDVVTITVYIQRGSVALFISVSSETPGPLDFDMYALDVNGDDGPAIFRVDRRKLAPRGTVVDDVSPGVYIGLVGSAALDSQLQIQAAGGHIEGFPPYVTVAENTAPGKLLAQPDAPASAVQLYSIVSGNDDDAFAIDAARGSVMLAKVLDYEQERRRVLTVRLQNVQEEGVGVDGPSPCSAAMADVEVRVLDTNDNTPYFVGTRQSVTPISQLTWAVAEVAAGRRAAARRLGFVFARDLDSNNFGEIRFRFGGLAPPKNFTIDAITGEVRTTAHLDFESEQHVVLTIVAADGGAPPREATLNLSIEVLDQTDEPPQFVQDLFAVSVSDNQLFSGQAIVTVEATDRDVGDTLRYELGRVGSDASIFSSIFFLNAVTGHVFVRPEARLRAGLYTTVAYVFDSAGAWDEANVRIHVESSNLPPTKIEASPVIVVETAGPGALLTRLSAQDAAGQALTWILSQAPWDGLSVQGDDHDGVIRLGTESLNGRRAGDVISLTVTCADDGSPSLNSTTTVAILVVEAAESPLSLQLEPSVPTVPESALAGTQVAMLLARDPDPSEVLTLQLITSGSGRFALGSTSCEELPAGQTGTECRAPLFLKRMLDFEAAGRWDLFASAKDSAGYAIFADIAITVTDVNEAPLNVQLVPAVIAETALVGDVVGRLVAQDPEDGNVTWTLPPADLPPQLRLREGTTDVLEVAMPLDYESNSTLTFVAVATDDGRPSQATQATLHVDILNVNEPPAWVADPQAAPEAWKAQLALPAVGSDTVARLDAIDLDDPTTALGRVQYWQLSQFGRFAVERDTGRVSVTPAAVAAGASGGVVGGATYNLDVVAVDGGGLRSSTATLSIQALKGPPPVRLRLQPSAIKEDADIGSIATRLVIEGMPANRVPEVLIEGRDASKLRFAPAAGTLQLLQALDFETQTALHLDVTVRDSNTNDVYLEKQQLVLSVVDVNEAPILSKKLYEARVNEDVAAGTIITLLTASDADRDLRFAGMSFHWGLSSPPPQLRLDERSGRVYTNGYVIDALSGRVQVVRFDFESQPTLALPVVVRDAAGLEDTATLSIQVNDVNEPPAFQERSPVVAIFENATAGQPVASFPALDPDVKPEYRGLRYFAVGGDVQVFRVDETTGHVLLRVALDFEVRRYYTLTVRVVDKPGLQDEIRVTFDVRNVNEAPFFEEDSYAITAAPLAPGDEVALPSASTQDALDDSGPCSGTVYVVEDISASSSTLGDDFQFDPIENSLTAAVAVPQGRNYFFRLIARDGCGLQATTLVSLAVEAAAGKLTLRLAPAEVSETAPAGTEVGNLLVLRGGRELGAEDVDVALVSAANGRFQLEGRSVRLAQKGQLNYEAFQTHAILVFVRDLVTREYMEETVTVAVADENEPPVWDVAESSASLILSPPLSAGEAVGAATASDPDAENSAWGKLSYTIVESTLPADALRIDAQTGQISVGASAAAVSALAEGVKGSVIVLATDGGGLTTGAREIAVAVARQGGAPTFAGAPWTIKMAAQQPLGSKILQVSAAPAPGQTVTYALERGDPYSLLRLNPRSGEILSAAVPARATLQRGPDRRRRDGSNALPERLDLSRPVAVVLSATDGVGRKSEATLTLAFFDGCSPEPCLPGYACAGILSEVTWSTCAAGVAFEAVSPSAHRDRICMACTTCGAQSFNIDGAGCQTDNSDKDRSCAPLRSCIAGKTFEAESPTPTSDRVCQKCTAACQQNEVLVRRCTAARDAVCAEEREVPVSACPQGQYRRDSDSVCVPCTACGPGFYAVADTCDGIVDRVCRRHTVCRTGVTYLHYAGTATSDAECRACIVCPSGVPILAACTTESDTVCDFEAAAAPQCTCPPGRIGPTCEGDVDLCANSPCADGSTCIEDSSAARGFRCICEEGVFGDDCEKSGPRCVPGTSDPCPVPQFCVVTNAATNEFVCQLPAGSTTRSQPGSTATTATFTSPSNRPGGSSKSGEGAGDRGSSDGRLVGIVCGVLVLLVLLVLLLLLLRRRRRKRQGHAKLETHVAPSLVAYTNPAFSASAVAEEAETFGEEPKRAGRQHGVHHGMPVAYNGPGAGGFAGDAHPGYDEPGRPRFLHSADGEYSDVACELPACIGASKHHPAYHNNVAGGVHAGGYDMAKSATLVNPVYDAARQGRDDDEAGYLDVSVWDESDALEASEGYDNVSRGVAYDAAGGRLEDAHIYAKAGPGGRRQAGYDTARQHTTGYDVAVGSSAEAQYDAVGGRPLDPLSGYAPLPADDTGDTGRGSTRAAKYAEAHGRPMVGYDMAGYRLSDPLYDLSGEGGIPTYAQAMAGVGRYDSETGTGDAVYDESGNVGYPSVNSYGAPAGGDDHAYSRAGKGGGGHMGYDYVPRSAGDSLYDVAASRARDNGGYEAVTTGAGPRYDNTAGQGGDDANYDQGVGHGYNRARGRGAAAAGYEIAGRLAGGSGYDTVSPASENHGYDNLGGEAGPAYDTAAAGRQRDAGYAEPEASDKLYDQARGGRGESLYDEASAANVGQSRPRLVQNGAYAASSRSQGARGGER